MGFMVIYKLYEKHLTPAGRYRELHFGRTKKTASEASISSLSPREAGSSLSTYWLQLCPVGQVPATRSMTPFLGRTSFVAQI